MFLEFVIGFTFRSFLDTHLRPEDRVLVLGDVDLIWRHTVAHSRHLINWRKWKRAFTHCLPFLLYWIRGHRRLKNCCLTSNCAFQITAGVLLICYVVIWTVYLPKRHFLVSTTCASSFSDNWKKLLPCSWAAAGARDDVACVRSCSGRRAVWRRSLQVSEKKLTCRHQLDWFRCLVSLKTFVIFRWLDTSMKANEPGNVWWSNW